MTNQANSNAVMQTSTNPTVKSVGAVGKISHLFKRSSTAAANDSSMVDLPASPEWTQKLIADGEALVNLYAQYKVEFFDRSDEAQWNLLERIYQYVLGIDGDEVNGTVKKQALVKHLKEHGYPKASGSNTTASLVVKYVFSDQAKQTISNYANTLTKAKGLKIPGDQLAAFLKSVGGYAKFLEAYFDQDGNVVADAPVNSELVEKKEAAVNRVKYVRRWFDVTGMSIPNSIDCSEIVFDAVPADPRKEDARKKDPENPKYTRGNFVFFVAVEGDKDNTYKLVQGFSANRQTEDNIVSQLAGLIPVSTEDLLQAVIDEECEAGLFDDEQRMPIGE